MRGALSLAAALALPLETDAGRPFPGRELIIFLTFSRHPRDARRPGADAAGRHPRARARRGRDRGPRGREGANPRGRGGAGAARGAGRRGLGAGGHGRARARRVSIPDRSLPRAPRRRERRRDRGPLAGLPAPAPRAARGRATGSRRLRRTRRDQQRRLACVWRATSTWRISVWTARPSAGLSADAYAVGSAGSAST